MTFQYNKQMNYTNIKTMEPNDTILDCAPKLTAKKHQGLDPWRRRFWTLAAKATLNWRKNSTENHEYAPQYVSSPTTIPA